MSIQISGSLNSPLENLEHLSLKKGALLKLAGKSVLIKKDEKDPGHYFKISDIANALLENKVSFSKQTKTSVKSLILEVINPDTRTSGSESRLATLFYKFREEIQNDPTLLNSEEKLLPKLEMIKDEMFSTKIPIISYQSNISEIAEKLMPGDIIVKKSHQDYPNSTCDGQKLFQRPGYREAYKFSHTATYLGKDLNGDHWIAEATTSRKGPDIRRIKLSDERFAPKPKNQYLIFRMTDQSASQENARLANNYCLKFLPETEKNGSKKDKIGSLKYSRYHAVNSLRRSTKHFLYGKQRLLLCYLDYQNKLPFEGVSRKRSFFCSYFTQLMISMSEMQTSDKFQKFIKKHPGPEFRGHNSKGLPRKIAKMIYGIKKYVWVKKLTLLHYRELKELFKGHLDPRHVNPQDAVNFMIDNEEKYKIIGITRQTAASDPSE